MTPSLAHASVMVAEVLQRARLRPGDVVVDATIGDGGHAEAMLERIGPTGRLIGLDIDPQQVRRATSRLRVASVAPGRWIVRQSFLRLPQVLAENGLAGADVILADLGVSSSQFDDPARGLNYKAVGPLDMRLNGAEGESAAELLARLTETELSAVLRDHSDEPHAALIARVLTAQLITTAHGLGRAIRAGLARFHPEIGKGEIKDSVRRTFQALRVAVNDERAALDTLLGLLPGCLRSGSRVVIVTFHVGEERLVKAAFEAGRAAGVYSAINEGIIRPSRPEILANRRVSSARLHWAVRA